MWEFSFRRCGGGTLSREVLRVLLCVACLSACSPVGIKTNGQDPWQIREGEFRASLLLTDDHEGLVETWRSSSDLQTPITVSLSHAEKGKPVYLIITFSNCISMIVEGYALPPSEKQVKYAIAIARVVSRGVV